MQLSKILGTQRPARHYFATRGQGILRKPLMQLQFRLEPPVRLRGLFCFPSEIRVLVDFTHINFGAEDGEGGTDAALVERRKQAVGVHPRAWKVTKDADQERWFSDECGVRSDHNCGTTW